MRSDYGSGFGFPPWEGAEKDIYLVVGSPGLKEDPEEGRKEAQTGSSMMFLTFYAHIPNNQGRT